MKPIALACHIETVDRDGHIPSRAVLFLVRKQEVVDTRINRLNKAIPDQGEDLVVQLGPLFLEA